MPDSARGIYRTRTEEGGACSAWITHGKSAVPEAIYRSQGYEPPFDDLPWKEEYDAANSAVKAHA